jgi:hypothetical protein
MSTREMDETVIRGTAFTAKAIKEIRHDAQSVDHALDGVHHDDEFC